MPGIRLCIVALALVAWAARGDAAEKLKIGFITTLSSPTTTNGREILDGFSLALDEAGGKFGGREVELVVGDDQVKPDIGVQLARKMLDEDRVDLIAGFVQSNVLLAAANVILPRKVFLLSLNGGPSQLAGKECSPYFFNVAFQNDTPAESVALYLEKKGVKSVYLMAPNYAAGRDAMAGFKRYFKGRIAGEVYTPLNQFDYAAEFAELRSVRPDAVYFFYTGGAPVINFVKQRAEAGLAGQIPFFTQTNPLDDQTLPAMDDAALGIQSGAQWNEDLDSPANKEFVAHFRTKYGRRPSITAANAYDGARLLEAALSTVDGHVERGDAFRTALETASFASVRGSFRFNTNHFPIQSFYLSEVEKDANGVLSNRLKERIAEDHADAYAGECRMP